MKAFVTGATGFIGGRLLKTLKERKLFDEIICLVRDPAKMNISLTGVPVQILKGDITEKESMRGGMKSSDVVFHIAAYYELGIAKSEVAKMEQINIQGTENVLSLAKELNVPKIVYVSTVFALGDSGAVTVDETHQHCGKFTSHYERTKYRAHLVAKKFAKEGLPLMIVLPSAVYGEGDPSALGKGIEEIVSGRAPGLIRGTENNRGTFTHVDDVVQAILLTVEKGKIGESYIAAGEVMTSKVLAETLADLGGVRPPKFFIPVGVARFFAFLDENFSRLRKKRPLISQEAINTALGNFAASNSKAKRELGFSPRSNREGFAQTIEWLKGRDKE